MDRQPQTDRLDFALSETKVATRERTYMRPGPLIKEGDIIPVYVRVVSILEGKGDLMLVTLASRSDDTPATTASYSDVVMEKPCQCGYGRR